MAPSISLTLGPLEPLRPLLEAAAELAGGPVWLVGGTVRDLLLGRPLHDVDLVLPRDSATVARRLADRLEGTFVPLGEPHGMARVVLAAPASLHFDLTDFRGANLDADLGGRDVTVDALAVELGALLRGPTEIRDPTGGLGDLVARRLRACRSTAFTDDPLRVLRLLRLAHQLDFGIEPDTERMARSAAPALASVSAERVRDELTHVLKLPPERPRHPPGRRVVGPSPGPARDRGDAGG